MASTNSKNCKLNNGGYLNNRTYRSQRAINKSNKAFAKAIGTLFTGLFGFLGLIILAIFSEYSQKKEQEKQAALKAEQELEKLYKQKERERKARERQAKKEAEENEIFDLWRKHMVAWFEGKRLYVGLQEFKNMTKKERNEWCDFVDGKVKYTKKMIKEQNGIVANALSVKNGCTTPSGILVVCEQEIIGKPKKKKKEIMPGLSHPSLSYAFAPCAFDYK